MTQSFSVECPFCHAKGELADPTLLGRTLVCPACQNMFMVSLPGAPAPVAPPQVAEPAAAVNQPTAPVPSQPAPSQPAFTPPAAAVAPSPPQHMQSTPSQMIAPAETPQEFRSYRPKKQGSKVLPMLVWGSISTTVVVWAAMFVFGVPAIPTARKPQSVSNKETGRSQKRKSTQLADSRPVDTEPMFRNEPASSEMMPAGSGQPEPAQTSLANQNAGPQDESNIPPEIVAKLRYAYDDESVPMLIEFLSHPHAGVRAQAAGLIRVRGKVSAAVVPLIKLLKDPVTHVRAVAANALEPNGIEFPDCISALGSALRNDPELEVRAAAAGSLGNIGKGDAARSKAVIAELLPALKTANEEACNYLAPACGSLGDAGPQEVAQLTELLKKHLQNASAVEALAELGQIDVLAPVIKGDDAWKKTAVARGLGRQRSMTPALLQVLTTFYKDSESSLRQSVITALETSEPKIAEAVQLLELAQADSDEWVRQSAATAIAKYDIKPEQKVRGLLKQYTLFKSNAMERFSISNALRAMNQEGLRQLLNILLKNREDAPEIWNAALEFFGDGESYEWGSISEDEELVASLKKVALDAEQTLALRASCIAYLKYVSQNQPEFDEVAKEAIQSDSLSFKLRERLASYSDRASIPMLVEIAEKLQEPLPNNLTEYAKHHRNGFRATVLRVLHDIHRNSNDSGNEKILPLYLSAIENGSDDVINVALSALGQFGRKSPESVTAALSKLKHESIYVRSNAISALKAIEAESAIPEIRASLKDENWTVRDAATTALGNFGPAAADAVPDLIAFTEAQGDEKWRSNQTLVALAKIAPQDEKVKAAITGGLHHSEMRSSALEALQILGPEARSVIPTLRKLIPTSDTLQLVAILNIFKQLHADAGEALPEMIPLLHYPDQYVRECAIQTIGALKKNAAPAVPDIVSLLNEANEQFQMHAIDALASIGPAAKSAIPDLEKLAASTDSQVLKGRIPRALHRISSNEDSVEAKLLEMFADNMNSESARQESMKDPATFIPALTLLTKDRDPSTRYRASALLDELTNSATGKEILLKWLESDDVRQQSLAVVCLNRLPTRYDPAELARQLISYLENDSKGWLVAPMILSLEGSAGPAVADALTSDSLTMNGRRQLNSVFDTTWVGRHQALGPLREMMKSDAPGRRQLAAIAIGRLNPYEPDLVPVIVESLNSDSLSRQSEAASVLDFMAREEVDISAAIPGLMKILSAIPDPTDKTDHDDERPRVVAAAALANAGRRPELIDELREILRKAAELAPDARTSNIAGEIGSAVLQALVITGSHSAEALPEIKAFLIAAPHADWSSLPSILDPSNTMLAEMAQSTELQHQTRVIAIQTLDRIIDDGPVPPLLLELIRDDDLHVKTEAAIVLSNHPEHDALAIPVLIEALRGNDNALRSRAIEQLGNLNGRGSQAVDELLRLAKDSTDSWHAAIAALFKIAPANPATHEVAMERLKSLPGEWVLYLFDSQREQLLSLLPTLIRNIEESSDPLRTRSALILGGFGEKAISAIPALRTLMKADQGDASVAAAIALAQIDPSIEETTPIVIAAFQDKKFGQQTPAALLRLGARASDIVPVLLERLRNPSSKFDAFSIIGHLGASAEPALPLLVESLQGGIDSYAARTALEALGDDASSVGPQLITMLKQNRSVELVAEVLAKLGKFKAEAIEWLLAQLQNDETRLRAVKTLKKFGAAAEPAADQLLVFAQGTDPDLRVAALATLGNIDSRAADSLPILLAALSDPNSHVAYVASNSLKELHKHVQKELPQIIKALEQNRQSTRYQLIELLSELGPAAKDALPTLNNMILQVNYYDRHFLRNAIKKINGEPTPKDK